MNLITTTLSTSLATPQLLDQPDLSPLISKTAISIVSVGSSDAGIIINSQGIMLTTYKKNYRKSPPIVTFNHGLSSPTVFVNAIPEAGFTLLKLTELPANFPIAKIGNPDMLEMGQALKIVNTSSTAKKRFHLGQVVGMMSRKTNASGKIIDYLQVETTTQQNNLSGPLFNLKGELLGLISAELLTGGNGRMAIATSINIALEILDSI